MSDTVNLLVPADPRFREIGPDLASRFCAAQGGSDADAASMAAAVSQAVSDLAAEGTGQCSLNFRTQEGQVEVTVQCDGRSTLVTQPLATPRAVT